jgi:two-component system chemotaxis sensor kinase CheA
VSLLEEPGAELRDLFFQSAQETLQLLDEQGLNLEATPADAEIVRSIRRAVHTLKGDAAASGFRELSELAHQLEDVLAPETAAAHAEALPELVLSAADMFDAMLAAHRAHLDPPSGEPLRALMQKLGQAHGGNGNGSLARFDWSEYDLLCMAEALGRGQRVYNIALSLTPDCALRAAGIQLLKNVLQETGEVLTISPGDADALVTGAIRVALASDHEPGWLSQKLLVPGVVADALIEPYCPAIESHSLAGPETEPAALASRSNGNGHRRVTSEPQLRRESGNNLLRVQAERIDAVLNLVGELIIAKSMLHQTLSEFSQRFPKDPLRSKLGDALAFQAQALNGLQHAVMQVRMVPVGQLFRRFTRLVHDVAEAGGKEVNLAIRGQETELDKSLLDALAEPLMHLMRNAVDHGLETPQQRQAAGKPAQGSVGLHAYHRGNQVVIEVSDDGRGIDAAQLISKAVERRLLTSEQAAHLSEADALDLIFEPGFSTAAQITEFSGRGVGMDVVQAAVQRVKGSISIQTKPGQGTTFQLCVPLTLAIIRAMLFRAGDKLYALPLEAVQEIARVSEAEIHHVDHREVLRLRDQVLPLARLAAPLPSPNGKTGRLYALAISGAEHKFGLVVDKLVGEEELVIKPLDETLVGSQLVSGASILGDGAVVLILNVAEVEKLGRAHCPAAVPGGNAPRALEAGA